MPGGVRRHDGREPTLGVGERFTERELGEILRRAAERSGDAWRAVGAERANGLGTQLVVAASRAIDAARTGTE
jgi:hypothetical protein